MTAQKHLLFKSSLFPPEPDEDAETNPGLFGKALALWLGQRLAESGYRALGYVAEDFGRLVQLEHPRFRTYVACSSTDESATEWRVFAIVEGGGLFAGREKAIVREKLIADVEAILRREPAVADLQTELA
jgi:hypothetical protein